MAGRKSKLTPDTQQAIVRLLEIGCTVEDTCDQVGIDKGTFYNWRTAGSKATGGVYYEFFNVTTRALSRARVAAVTAVRTAMTGLQTVEDTTTTLEETRLRTNKEGEQIPFTYRKTTTSSKIIKHPPDWRAGIEYLKRRDPEHWTDRLKVEDWRDQAIADIRAGRIPFAALAEAFDLSLAEQLFREAGVRIE